MRRIAAVVLFALLAAGCGKGGTQTLTPAQAVRAAAKTSTETSSKMDLVTKTKVQGQDITVEVRGEADNAAGNQLGDFDVNFNGESIKELIVGGVLYLQLPGQPSYYSIPFSELAGTSFGETSNPANAAQLLAAVSDGTTKVGTETIGGVTTTHYKTTISLAKAKAQAPNEFARKSVQKLIDGGVTQVPADVYVDDSGRLRRMVETFTVMIKATSADVTTQLDLSDYGIAVTVQKPPASQIKDGSQILQLIKSQMG